MVIIINIWLIFLALSFGTLINLSGGSVQYNLLVVEVVILLVFLSILFRAWRKRLKIRISTSKTIFYLLWFLCFLYSLFTYLWSNNGISVLAGSISLFMGLISFIIAEYYFKDNPNLFVSANRLLIISLLIQLVLSMFFGIEIKPSIYNDLGSNDFYGLKHTAVTFLGASNYISFFFSFGLLYEFIAQERMSFVFIIANVVGIVLTMSRSAVVSIGLALFVYTAIIFLNPKTKKIKTFTGFTAILVGCYLAIQYTDFGWQLWDNMQDGLQVSSMNARLYLWDMAVTQITSQPFGYGIVWRDDPHNFILKSIRDLGVGFGSIYVLLISYPLLHFLKFNIYRLPIRLLAALIAYLAVYTHAMLEVFFFGTSSIIWATMTLSFISVISQQLVIQGAKKRIASTNYNSLSNHCSFKLFTTNRS